MSNPPDHGNLWTNTAIDTSGDVSKAQGAIEAAQKVEAGIPFAAEGDQDFFKKKAAADMAYGQAQLGAAQHGVKQYQEQAFAVQQHNEPIEHARREAETQRTNQVLENTAGFVGAAVVATAAVGMAAEMGSPGIVSHGFAGISGGTGPATTMAMGPMAMFAGLSRTPQQLGIEPALDRQLGPVMPAVAIDAVAKASPAVAADPDAPAVTADVVNTAPIRPRALGAELHHNSLAYGPTIPESWKAKPIGGGSPGS